MFKSEELNYWTCFWGSFESKATIPLAWSKDFPMGLMLSINFNAFKIGRPKLLGLFLRQLCVWSNNSSCPEQRFPYGTDAEYQFRISTLVWLCAHHCKLPAAPQPQSNNPDQVNIKSWQKICLHYKLHLLLFNKKSVKKIVNRANLSKGKRLQHANLAIPILAWYNYITKRYCNL